MSSKAKLFLLFFISFIIICLSPFIGWHKLDYGNILNKEMVDNYVFFVAHVCQE